MGHHQPDKADDAGKGNHHPGDQRACDEDGQAKPRDRNAKRGGGFIPQAHRVEGGGLRPKPQARRDQDGGGVDQVRPLRKAKAAKHPEDDRMRGLGIAEEDQDIGPRHDDETDGDPGQHQPVGAGCSGQAGGGKDHQRGRQRSAKGHERHGEKAKEQPCVQKRGNGPERPARGDAKKVGVGKRVARDRLQRRPRDPQPRPDKRGEEGAGKADVPDDGLTACGPVGGDKVRDQLVGQNAPDSRKGNRHRPDRHGKEDGQQQRPAARQRKAGLARQAQGGSGRGDKGRFGHGTWSTICRAAVRPERKAPWAVPEYTGSAASPAKTRRPSQSAPASARRVSGEVPVAWKE